MFDPSNMNIIHAKEFARDATNMIYELLEEGLKQELPAFEQYLKENDIDRSLLDSIIDKTRQSQRLQALQRFKTDPDFRRAIIQLVISKRALMASHESEQMPKIGLAK